MIRINRDNIAASQRKVHDEYVGKVPVIRQVRERIWGKYDVEKFVYDTPVTLASLEKVGRIKDINEYISNRKRR